MDENIKKLFKVDISNIPESIPIFPLDNVLLLPFGKLPLNIFEERYIKMTLDSLKNHKMIGIIQPKNNNNELFQMGCIGKITSYIETSDYRLVLNLEGVCRFVLKERNLTPRGYYQASISCGDYANDLMDVEPHIDRNSLIQKYSNYFKMKKLEIDKEVKYLVNFAYNSALDIIQANVLAFEEMVYMLVDSQTLNTNDLNNFKINYK